MYCDEQPSDWGTLVTLQKDAKTGKEITIKIQHDKLETEEVVENDGKIWRDDSVKKMYGDGDGNRLQQNNFAQQITCQRNKFK